MWTIARQHPGETMAEFFMEGFIERLLDETDPVTRKLRRAATFYCVPNMCPGECFCIMMNFFDLILYFLFKLQTVLSGVICVLTLVVRT